MDPELLLDWFDANARELPWREREPVANRGWRVLVSEIMLQQTPVNRVLPVYEEWIRRWPKPSALAGASQGEVLRAWGKLGYPRRALRLHQTATVIATEHGDVVPADVETLLRLPGIGDYTARAVAAFAYDKRAPVVDTNVRRVVARAVHGAGDAGPASMTRDMADVEQLLPDDEARAARLSAALMELGALVCVARTPRCSRCPLVQTCAWQRAGCPAYTGQPARPVQRYAGTDRHVRGLLLDVLRGSPEPVDKTQLDAAWPIDGQRDRCLHSLLEDGLVEQIADGRFALPGEHSTVNGN
ncbi:MULTISPECIES: A/G-specific adenine glycosylase [Thermocrispum]|mgnify:CR=1 FL=1|uniref:Adenine DNA glycosylase n=1 Tax=Thermocrispum agreste TaxID=37925 RepID=A0A2W4JM91_9PSEU|nr:MULTISPECIES: A/G-specific adenine glycosylase [Thermocrispum]PZM99358.1 MAG: A/G-specific adenine glycosylase [Thermocrispum agreste]